MTTEPVMSVTDELITELEDVAHGKDEDAIEVHGISVGIVRALLSERAELKRDAERLSFMIDECCVMECMNGTASPIVYRLYWPHEGEAQTEWHSSKRAAIDTAMQAAKC